VDSLPPTSPPALAPASAIYAVAPGDIYPRDPREIALCHAASHPDWIYLGGLLALDVGAVWAGSSDAIRTAPTVLGRMTGPAMIGLVWGATVGGAWLALPKCSPEWIGETPREGGGRASWPLALSLALLAGVTAPVVNAIAVGATQPVEWTNLEREMHVVTAGLAGLGGALLPYLIPPRTWAAARELDRLRFETDGRGGAVVRYSLAF